MLEFVGSASNAKRGGPQSFQYDEEYDSTAMLEHSEPEEWKLRPSHSRIPQSYRTPKVYLSSKG